METRRRGTRHAAAPRRKWWRFALVALAMLLPLAVSLPARADGLFVKSGHFPLPPSIPAQRALVIHRDGVQRLVVESTLDAEGQSFGWILPVPARPTEVREASPGILDTLDLATLPRLEVSPGWFEPAVAALASFLLALLFHLARAFERARESGRRPVALGLGLAFGLGCVILLVIVSVPNLLAARLSLSMPVVPGVTASETERVGSYEVTVLEARDAAALDAWLEARGLAALPAAGRPVVDAHIAEGWAFVAVRLARDGRGPASPHPLALACPSPGPVYPMRLTALAGGTTALRLFVVADGSAGCEPLAVAFSGKFRRVAGSGFGAGGDGVEQGDAFLWGGNLSGRALGHPYLVEHLWDGCVVTRFDGSLAAAAMDRDLRPVVGPTVEHEPVVYTVGAAWHEGISAVLPVWALLLLLSALPPHEALPRLPGTRGPGSKAAGWILAITLGAGLAAGLVRATRTTIPDASVSPRAPGRNPAYEGASLLQLRDDYAGKPRAEVEALVLRHFHETDVRSPRTGKPPRVGNSPGDFEVLEDHRGAVLRTWGISGAPLDRSWWAQRLDRAMGRLGHPGAGGAIGHRRRLFPGGAFTGGVRNPFTGEPVREGREPGDAEIVEEEGRVVLRAWCREGKYFDLPVR